MPASPRVRPLHLIVLGLILLAAALVRIKGISAEGLWIDELYSLEFSGGYGFPTDKLLPRNTVIESPPLLTSLHGAPATWRIWTTLGDDIHPPLYYIVLRIWREMFGSSDVAIRSLSVLASLVAIVLLFDLGRLLFSLGAGLWAALLMAIAQPQIWYAQEARGYLMATALTLGAAGALVRIEQRGFTRARAVALGLCLLVSVLTHYASAATGLALASYALIRLRGRRRWQVLGVLAASALVFLVIWGPFLLQQPRGASFASPIFHEPRTDAVTPLLKRLIILPMTFFSRPPGPTEYAAALAWVLLLLPLIFLRRRPQLLLATLWAAFWIGIPALTDLIRHMRLLEQFRYVLGAAPALYLLAAGLLSDRGRWFAHLLPLGFGAYCAISLPWAYAQHKGEWEKLGHDAASRINSGDLVIFATPTVGDWYSPILVLDVQHYAPELRGPIAILTQPATPQVIQRARTTRTFLVGDAQTDISTLLPGAQTVNSKLAFPVGRVSEVVWR